MPSVKDIKKAVKATDKLLMAKQSQHIKNIEEALKRLQRSIINASSILKVKKNGGLEGIRLNLKNAQKLHRRIEDLFASEFTDEMKIMIKDFKPISTSIRRSYRYLDEAVEFTDIDRGALTVLRDGIWRDYVTAGNVKKQKIIQSVYDLVVGGGDFNDVVTAISAAIVGTEAGIGRNLLADARTLARDSVMQYHQEVNNLVAEKIGLKHFLYIGDIIQTTRDFCRKRVGKVYTRKQIDSWTFKWAGKSGPAYTHRGGYNCRHHWQGIRPEWMEGKKKLDVADWGLEQREKG